MFIYGQYMSHIKPLQNSLILFVAKVRELHQELEKYLTGFMAKKQAQIVFFMRPMLLLRVDMGFKMAVTNSCMV